MSPWLRRSALGIGIGLLATVGACRQAETPPDDAAIAVEVRRELAENDELQSFPISVTVNGGMLTLAGRVGSADQRQQAEKVARDVDGVRSVANQIEVVLIAPPPVAAPPPVIAPLPAEPPPAE